MVTTGNMICMTDLWEAEEERREKLEGKGKKVKERKEKYGFSRF